jgi:ribonuclease HI
LRDPVANNKLYMDKILLFVDGSVHAQSKAGYGAYLLVWENELLLESFKPEVKLKRFENTNSTQLELQTLLWALKEIQAITANVVVYTDSQNIMGLPGRREALEQKNYHSKKNVLLQNHELYCEFYRLLDEMDFELLKVQGHMPSRQKINIDKLFTLVDRASRKAMKGENF